MKKGRASRKQKWQPGKPRLTPRQAQVMELVKLGLADKEIASRLRISTLAVSNQLCNGVFPRLNALNRAHAVYLCIKEGIII